MKPKLRRKNLVTRSSLLTDPRGGCPVVSSLSGASYVVLVTEPTVSGLHDLRRVHELVERFGIKSGCIINKADINAEQREKIRDFMVKKGMDFLGEIPYDEDFTRAMTMGKTIVEYSGRVGEILKEAWKKVLDLA